jgi:hypothetical protein
MDEVISTIVILISIASSAAGLGYWLAKQFGNIHIKFKEIDVKFKEIDMRFDEIRMQLRGLEKRIDRLERGIFNFNELLLKVLEAKGVIGKVEAMSLMTTLHTMIPSSGSKYYTKEVEKRLRELLSMDPEKYTMEDIKELEKIADIMEEEYMVSERKELIDFASKLRIAALVLKIVFVEPKIRKLKEWPLGP